MSTRLTIFDTTLRDGEQAPGFSMRTDEKLKMARQLAALGADVIEAGFPIASDADAESVRMISTHVRGPVIAALARCHPADIDRAGWALDPAPRRRIHVFIATSDLHLERKLRMSRDACLDAAVAAIHRARRYADDVQFSAEDATRSDTGLPVPGHRRSDFGRLHDDQPAGHGRLFHSGRNRAVSSRRSSSGCRTRGTRRSARTVTTTSGSPSRTPLRRSRAGARQVECTINGIGERAGNASLEEFVMATRVRSDILPFTTAVDTRQIYPTSQLLTALTGEGVQANKAIVGRNAFAHEAGIHQDGMLKDRRTYEIMRPEEVGVPQATLVLGKHSGRHAVQRRCELVGVTLEGRELDEVYRAAIAHADREKVVTDRDLLSIVAQLRGASSKPAPVLVPIVADFHNTPAESGYGHGV